MALAEPLSKAPFAAQAPLERGHRPIVDLVVVAKQMEQAVERKHTQLDRLAVPCLDRLATRHTAGDHDVSQKMMRDQGFGIRGGSTTGRGVVISGALDMSARLVRGKAQDIGRVIAAPVPPVERAD